MAGKGAVLFGMLVHDGRKLEVNDPLFNLGLYVLYCGVLRRVQPNISLLVRMLMASVLGLFDPDACR